MIELMVIGVAGVDMREVLLQEERHRSMPPPPPEHPGGAAIQAKRSASGWDAKPAASPPVPGQRSLSVQWLFM